MTVLLQISDPHFGTERPEVVDALERFVHELQPGVLLLSGDITQRATAAQFAAARAFVDRLAVPTVLAIPGNHDTPLFNVMAPLFGSNRRPLLVGRLLAEILMQPLKAFGLFGTAATFSALLGVVAGCGAEVAGSAAAVAAAQAAQASQAQAQQTQIIKALNQGQEAAAARAASAAD